MSFDRFALVGPPNKSAEEPQKEEEIKITEKDAKEALKIILLELQAVTGTVPEDKDRRRKASSGARKLLQQIDKSVGLQVLITTLKVQFEIKKLMKPSDKTRTEPLGWKKAYWQIDQLKYDDYDYGAFTTTLSTFPIPDDSLDDPKLKADKK